MPLPAGPDRRVRGDRPGRHRRAADGQERRRPPPTSSPSSPTRRTRPSSPQFFPPPRAVAAQRRDARPRPTRCSRPTSSQDGGHRRHRDRRGQAQPHRLGRDRADGARRARRRCGSRTPTSRPCSTASARRSSRCWRRMTWPSHRTTPGPREPRPSARRPAAQASVLDHRAPRRARRLPVRRAAARRHRRSSCCVPLGLVVWYRCTSGTCWPAPSTFVGARQLRAAAARPEAARAVLRRHRRSSRPGWWCSTSSLALLLAVLLNQKLRGITVFRTLFFSPVVVSLVAWTIVWGFLLQDNGGINGAARRWSASTGPTGCAATATAMVSVIVVQVFKNVGLNMVLFLAALQGVPARAVRGRARRRGAGRWTQFRRITVPLISPTILLTSIITIVGSLQVFAQIAVLTQGGPGMSTTVLVYYLYQQAFQFHHFGYGVDAVDPAVRSSSLVLTVAAVAAAQEDGSSMRTERHGPRAQRLAPRTALLLRAAAIPFVFPTWWMVTSSVKPISEIFAFPPDAAARRIRRSTPTARCSRCSRSRSSTSTASTSPRSSPSARWRSRRWPATPSRASGSPGQNVLFLVVLIGLLIPSEVTIVPLFQMFHALGHDRHALAADPGADLRRAERAGHLHHAAVLHHAAGRAGGGGPRRRARPVRASSGGSRCRWPGRRSARSRSSPSCTAGTSTSSRSCSCPRPSKFTLPQALTQLRRRLRRPDVEHPARRRHADRAARC